MCGIRWPLGCDVLIDVEEVAWTVVLAVVVLDLVVIVVLHEGPRGASLPPSLLATLAPEVSTADLG